MKETIQFDTNMIVESKLDLPDVKFYDIDDEPIRIYGVWKEGGCYHRMPQAVADTVSHGISVKCTATAGGRIRFVTDSPYVAIRAYYGGCELTPSSSNLAKAGFDMYADGKFAGSFRLPKGFDAVSLESVVKLPGERKERLITINMPLYSGIESMYVGLSEDAKISHAPDYKLEKPVVFYGSSITNGAGASRPGANYVSRLARKLDINYVNLGFGGLAKAELQMAEYVAGLEMSAFVYDYDHNARTLEYLEETHERMFKIVREKNPDLPILIISKPDKNETEEVRFAVIKRTYENAIAAGDKNVYILRGTEFFGENGTDFTVDGIHPSDLGYYYMSEEIYPTLAKILQISTEK